MIYTGIGSRETPDWCLNAMTELAMDLAKKGWTLRSGGAEGADSAFEFGAIEAKGKKEIYVPWEGFNGTPKGNPDYIVGYSKEAEEVAARFHPAWEKCNRAARLFHTRNVYQIAGLDLSTPTDVVICWTPQGSGSGGTGQALRIAKYLQLPILDLGTSLTLTEVKALLADMGKKAS